MAETTDGMTVADVVVLVPMHGTFGELQVCTAVDLIERLNDGESFEDAVNNSAIDSIEPTPDQLRRVARLNATGDANAYWDI